MNMDDLPAKIEDEMTDAGKATGTPKQSKGGIFAPTDIEIIKKALIAYTQAYSLGNTEHRQVVNLLHRLNSRT
jgi:hypothetical protein